MIIWIWHDSGSCNRAFCYFVAHDDYDDDGCLIRYRWAISTWICRYGYADLQIESIVLPAAMVMPRAGIVYEWRKAILIQMRWQQHDVMMASAVFGWCCRKWRLALAPSPNRWLL